MADERPIFSRQQLQDTLRTRDAIKEIQLSLKSMGSDISSVSKDFTAVNKSANNFASAQEKAKADTSNIKQLLKESNNLIGKANKLTAEVSNKEKQRQTNIELISQKYKELNTTTKKNKEQIRDQIKTLENQNDELQRSSEALLAAADHTTVLGNNFRDLATTSVEISRNGYGIAAGISKTLKLSHHLTDSFEKANNIQRQRKIILAEEADLNERIQNAVDDYNEGKKKSLRITREQMLEEGKGLTRLRAQRTGLDAFTEGAVGGKGAKRLRQRSDALKNTRTALPSELTTLFKGLAKTIGSLAKGLILLKGIGKVVEFIQYAIFGVEQEAIDLGRAFTLSREEAKALRKDIGQIASDLKMGAVNASDLVKFQIEFAKSTGFSTKLNREQFRTITLMTKQLGFSNEEAIHMIENFKAAGLATEEGFNGLMKSYNAMKLQGKATTTFKALMHDITTDAELQRIYLTQGADAAMRNAQAQRRTGLSLAQQRSMAEGTLDFEKVMSDQLELRLLTGKDINLQRAQELALQGKNGEAVAEIQKQMGKLSAEQRKSPIIMNKMLSVLGMSREQYYEMLNAQQLQAKAQKEEERIVKMLQKETGVFHELKKRTFTSELDFINTLKGKRKEEAEDELLNYKKSDEYIKDINNLRKNGVAEEDLAQTALNNKLQQFSDQQIKNARIRAGLVDGELASFGNLRTTGEAFEDTMNRLKGQFANLVNQGVIEDLTTMLVDFVQRVSEVGLGSAILGGGAEEVAKRQADELIANAKSEEEREKIRNLLDQATTSTAESAKKYLSYLDPTYVGGRMSREQLKFVQEDAQQQLSQMAAAANTVDDFILRPGEPPIKFNRGDILMGGTQLGSGNGKIESLLEELLAETKAGKVIKMDTVTVANSLRRNAIKMNT